MTEGWSGAKTAEIVGITYRQLDYWARTDLIRPGLADANGSGTRRRYSYANLLELKVIKRLLDAGIRLEQVREVFDYLRQQVGADVASANLVIDGHSVVLARDDGELIDLVRKGQGVLNILSLANVKLEVDAHLSDIKVRPITHGRPARRRSVTRKHSPLDAAHRALGARMVEFGGWEMPLSYPAGTIAEHEACRADAVAFDVSHLGTVRVEGADAFDRLQRAFTNDLGKVAAGRAQYTHLLDAGDASVLDDIIVWWVDEGRFDVMPNASNTDRVVAALGLAEDVTSTRAIVAVQGPAARDRLAGVAPDAAAVGRFRVAPFTWDGVDCLVAGTGYTGEDGVECAIPAERAPDFWDAVLSAGVAPAGLGARDTLRLEAGLPLHGHELGPGITPLQAGLGWVVGWGKGDFAGRAALEAEKERGVDRKLRGIVTEGRRPPRTDQPVLIDGAPAGAVTSGNFSPELGCGIAMAFLPPDVEDGTPVEIDARGTRVPGRVVPLPFYKRA